MNGSFLHPRVRLIVSAVATVALLGLATAAAWAHTGVTTWLVLAAVTDAHGAALRSAGLVPAGDEVWGDDGALQGALGAAFATAIVPPWIIPGAGVIVLVVLLT